MRERRQNVGANLAFRAALRIRFHVLIGFPRRPEISGRSSHGSSFVLSGTAEQEIHCTGLEFTRHRAEYRRFNDAEAESTSKAVDHVFVPIIDYVAENVLVTEECSGFFDNA